MTASGHTGPHDGQSIASAIVETASGHSESVSAPNDPGSGPKTATGSDETAHGQKAIMKSHGENAGVHATANGLWSESANPETESGHYDALHGKLDPEGEISVKSASGSGHRWSLLVLQSVTDEYALENGEHKDCTGKGSASTRDS